MIRIDVSYDLMSCRCLQGGSCLVLMYPCCVVLTLLRLAGSFSATNSTASTPWRPARQPPPASTQICSINTSVPSRKHSLFRPAPSNRFCATSDLLSWKQQNSRRLRNSLLGPFPTANSFSKRSWRPPFDNSPSWSFLLFFSFLDTLYACLYPVCCFRKAPRGSPRSHVYPHGEL